MKNISLKSIPQSLAGLTASLSRYSVGLFVFLILVIYGFIAYRIQMLHSAKPTEAAVSEQVKAAKIPHIDDAVVKQLETLRDNSVSVQALFDGARSNPFQE